MMSVGARILNLSIELSGVILCAMGILLVVFSKANQRTRRYFILFYSGLIVLAVSNMVGLLMRGLPGAGWRAALYASNFTEFLMPTVLTYIVTRYLLSIVDPRQENRKLSIFLLVLLILDVAALIVSQFTGLYYILDENNIYQRSAAYPTAYLATAIILGIDIYLLLQRGKALAEKERTAFRVYFILPTIAVVLQNIQYGINFTIFSTIIAGLAMYIFIVRDQTERYYRQEQENARLQTEIMLSQIQPHFLNNTLVAIGRLCNGVPEAKAALYKFTNYLQGNMDALSKTDPIPFATELEHTKAFLELEQLRFGEKLNVVYDLEATAFLLPTLTLQPIVENAVEHGVRENEDGAGTVTISSREFPDRWEISVIDDGPGFDPNEIGSDGERHIGLQNVRERLRHVSGGELRIESAPGKGCRVTIELPKDMGGNDADIRH